MTSEKADKSGRRRIWLTSRCYIGTHRREIKAAVRRGLMMVKNNVKCSIQRGEKRAGEVDADGGKGYIGKVADMVGRH